MAINWKAFYANGGYSNENSDPLSYDEGEDDENEDENENDNDNENEPHKLSATFQTL